MSRRDQAGRATLPPPETTTAPPSGGEGRTTLERPEQRQWVPRAAWFATMLVGVLDVASGVRHGLPGRFDVVAKMLPGYVTSAASAFTIVIGILLVLLAQALRRRKRRAWRAVVALLALGAAGHVLRLLSGGGRVWAPATVSVLFLVALVVYRREFFAAGDPRTRWRAVTIFLLLSATSLVLGGLIVDIRPRLIIGHPSVVDRFLHVVYGFVGATGPVHFRSERYADFVTFTLFGLGLMTVLTTVYLALRPAEPQARLSTDDEDRMRALLDRYGGGDSLGYFALRRDKSVLWSPTGKSCIAYRVVSGVMLASGDPLGDPEAWPGAITAFLEEAQRHAWVPAVIGCSERAGEAWCRAGDMSALELGDEAVVEVEDFSLEGRPMRNVRQMVNRVERAGYECEVRRLRDVTDDARMLARVQASSWRGTETERGFSMALGRFGDPKDPDCVVVTASKDGVLRAFLHFVPWGPDGLSLDLMRRDRTADAGVNELLIVSALKAAPELGVKRVSLNFAAFRSALERGERLGAGPVLRAWRRLLLFASRWFQIESLYRFNAKFRPLWEPRFLVFTKTRDIPRIAVAALEAEAFIVMPSLSMRRHRPRTVERAPGGKDA